ncbi:syntaxin-18 isoform X2 [Hypomesus transpacificus]|uniref:syntaxin-18 isoform X2 n=1 Tax=Hypomesus transpacificus TaxID=137520 RepID=UPI001F08520E|nr:syntaxin-18 isoform X2 [Hypomesus transpacificus]
MVRENNTITLRQTRILADHATLRNIQTVSLSTLDRVLSRNAMRMKQVYRVLFDRNTDHIKELRQEFVLSIQEHDTANELYEYIYIEEVGFNLVKRKRGGRNFIGQHAIVEVPAEREVCKLYSEQRAIRVKRVVDKKRLSRLEPEHHSKAEKGVQQQMEHTEEKTAKEESTERSVTEVPESSINPWEEGRVEDELSPEEIQMFEHENQRLVSEMSNLVDEVRQIEGKVVEISRLQEIFAEKVLQQETEIDSIHQLVVGATENVKEGNEDIREAIQNNAGFRVWILFFLVMCSFSLLFLDWYDS